VPGRQPWHQRSYSEAAGDLSGRIQFVEQPAPLGYGHALHCAASFVGDDPFLHLVSDHLYVSRGTVDAPGQLVQAAEAHECSVSAVQPRGENFADAIWDRGDVACRLRIGCMKWKTSSKNRRRRRPSNR